MDEVEENDKGNDEENDKGNDKGNDKENNEVRGNEDHHSNHKELVNNTLEEPFHDLVVMVNNEEVIGLYHYNNHFDTYYVAFGLDNSLEQLEKNVHIQNHHDYHKYYIHNSFY